MLSYIFADSFVDEKAALRHARPGRMRARPILKHFARATAEIDCSRCFFATANIPKTMIASAISARRRLLAMNNFSRWHKFKSKSRFEKPPSCHVHAHAPCHRPPCSRSCSCLFVHAMFITTMHVHAHLPVPMLMPHLYVCPSAKLLRR